MTPADAAGLKQPLEREKKRILHKLEQLRRGYSTVVTRDCRDEGQERTTGGYLPLH